MQKRPQNAGAVMLRGPLFLIRKIQLSSFLVEGSEPTLSPLPPSQFRRSLTILSLRPHLPIRPLGAQ